MNHDLVGVHPELALRVEFMLMECKGLVIESGFRTRAEQQRLWDLYQSDPKRNATAAKPGTSNHEKGLAVDVGCSWLYMIQRALLARRYGLHTPVKGELWHMELAPDRPPLPIKTLSEATKLTGKQAIALLPTKTDKGYFIVANDGGVFAYGDATFYGSMGDKALQAPIVDAKLTSTGQGYFLLGADGGVFAFGDAKYIGNAKDYLK